MIKRQQRLQRIANVADEHSAALSASRLLQTRVRADPSFGRESGWQTRSAVAFAENLEATYIVRMFAEFEAGLRDYWRTFLGQMTRPRTVDLIRHAIPNQLFSQDCVDNADDVRVYRNFLVHEIDEEPPDDMLTFTVAEAKKHLCTDFGRLSASWR